MVGVDGDARLVGREVEYDDERLLAVSSTERDDVLGMEVAAGDDRPLGAVGVGDVVVDAVERPVRTERRVLLADREQPLVALADPRAGVVPRDSVAPPPLSDLLAGVHHRDARQRRRRRAGGGGGRVPALDAVPRLVVVLDVLEEPRAVGEPDLRAPVDRVEQRRGGLGAAANSQFVRDSAAQTAELLNPARVGSDLIGLGAAGAQFGDFLVDEEEIAVFDGGAWRLARELFAALDNLARLGVGTSADAANPFSAKLNAALWTALETGAGGTGDLRYTLNKQAAGNVVSMLFQSGWSGRAEMGLIGGENFAIRMSQDGASFIEALTLTGAGKVGINTTSPVDVLHIKNEGDIRTCMQVENDLANANGQAQIQARTDAADVLIVSHGSGIALNRWGTALAGWNEVLSSSGNGLALGSVDAQPVRIGTDSTTRLFLSQTGNIGLATDAPTEAFDIDADAIRLRQSRTPTSAAATGEAGTLCWNGDYVYVCVAANTWKRAALASW